jgi:hypothetical protein
MGRRSLEFSEPQRTSGKVDMPKSYLRDAPERWKKCEVVSAMNWWPDLGDGSYDPWVRVTLIVLGVILILLGLGLAFTIFGLIAALLGVVCICVGVLVLGGRSGHNTDVR